jgi:hypothetical protein
LKQVDKDLHPAARRLERVRELMVPLLIDVAGNTGDSAPRKEKVPLLVAGNTTDFFSLCL